MRGIYHLSQLASQIATRPPEWGAGAKLTPALKRGAGVNWTARSQNQGPMGAQVPVLSPNDHQNQSQGQLKGFRKSNFENFSGATKQPNQQQNSAFLGAHGVCYMGLVATMWVPMGAQVPVLSPNDHQDHSQGQLKGFAENQILKKFSGATKQPKQQQFSAFPGAHGACYMGLVATTWVPMGAQVPVLSPNDHPNPSYGH